MIYYDEDINIQTAIVANLSKVNRNYSIISSWWERFNIWEDVVSYQRFHFLHIAQNNHYYFILIHLMWYSTFYVQKHKNKLVQQKLMQWYQQKIPSKIQHENIYSVIITLCTTSWFLILRINIVKSYIILYSKIFIVR